MDGYLLVEKPAGWTSHDVVAKVRGQLKKETGQRVKVGHTGTLDPFATGLLILVVGKATKRASEFSKLDKTYEAELKLGFTSSTGDVDGELTKVSSRKPSRAEIDAALDKFVGQINQTPHAFSAIKVAGQRAYKLARAGEKPVLEPRKVNIYSIENVEYDYPKLSFTTSVSSGTYIRSLAEDIGKELGTGAYLSTLRRTKVGGFNIAKAQVLTNIANEGIITEYGDLTK